MISTYDLDYKTWFFKTVLLSLVVCIFLFGNDNIKDAISLLWFFVCAFIFLAAWGNLVIKKTEYTKRLIIFELISCCALFLVFAYFGYIALAVCHIISRTIFIISAWEG